MGEAICKGCRWLREPESTNPVIRDHYMVRGWPVPPLPRVVLGVSIRHDDTEEQRFITRKIINELGHLQAECPAFEPKESDSK